MEEEQEVMGPSKKRRSLESTLLPWAAKIHAWNDGFTAMVLGDPYLKPPVATHTCCICGRGFGSGRSLGSHMRWHDEVEKAAVAESLNARIRPRSKLLEHRNPNNTTVDPILSSRKLSPASSTSESSTGNDGQPRWLTTVPNTSCYQLKIEEACKQKQKSIRHGVDDDIVKHNLSFRLNFAWEPEKGERAGCCERNDDCIRGRNNGVLLPLFPQTSGEDLDLELRLGCLAPQKEN